MVDISSSIVHSPAGQLAYPKEVQETIDQNKKLGFTFISAMFKPCDEAGAKPDVEGKPGWCVTVKHPHRREPYRIWLFDFDPLEHEPAISVDVEIC